MKQLAFFQAVTRLVFGEGALERTGEVLRENGATRALVITDPGLVVSGLVAEVVRALEGAGLSAALFAEVEPDPSIETVNAAVAAYRAQDCDSFLALGGGSPLDCAKGAAVLASHPGELEDYFGIGKIIYPPPALVAIPTTVGTGSEVTNFAVISDRARCMKRVIGSPLVAPRAAILDPQAVRSLPERLVAATGMDALTHAVESVISVLASPFTDALALEAIRLVGEHLPAALRDGGLEHRGQLLYASTMAGQAFSFARTGLVHGMAHPVGSYHHVHHGLAVAILLPYVLEFNLPECAPQLARVAAALGAPAEPRAAVAAIAGLKAAVGIPSGLRQAGVTEEFLLQMARDAFESGNAQVVNPRKPTYEQVLELYQQALQ